MEEVIARRHIMQVKACLILIVAGVMGLALGVFFVVAKELNLFSYPQERLWALAVIASIEFFIAVCAITWGIIALKKAKMPPELIVLKGNKLTFADGYFCDIKEIVNVSYHIFKMDTSGIGKLEIQLTDRVIKYKQVENVVQAYQRLMELMQQPR